MYQRKLWEERENGGAITSDSQKIHTSISKLEFYNEWFHNIKKAKRQSQVRENEMREESTDECSTAMQSLKRDLLKITADSYKPYQAYPSDIFEVPGFREFVEKGYYQML